MRGCLVTGGTDKLVKIWNVVDQGSSNKRNVSLVTSRDLGIVYFIPLHTAFVDSAPGQSFLGRIFT